MQYGQHFAKKLAALTLLLACGWVGGFAPRRNGRRQLPTSKTTPSSSSKANDGLDSSLTSATVLEYPSNDVPQNVVTHQANFTLIKPANVTTKNKRPWQRKDADASASSLTKQQWNFVYNYDTLSIPANKNNNTKTTAATSTTTKTTGILLIHPIGVGIAKWYYRRLLNAFGETQEQLPNNHLHFVVPDLLASGSAVVVDARQHTHLPLLNISDWTNQILSVMAREQENVDEWCLVANGGCSPIALQVAAASVNNQTMTSPPIVTQVILSSTPRLPFFLQACNPIKVQRAYRRLTGLLGNLFWWYATRNQGAFVQTFSEKNLVADPAHLGDKWRPNCYRAATSHHGASRYSTFAFLAGTLQHGCVASLQSLIDYSSSKNIRVDVIRGADVRQRRAKSWFWQRPTTRKTNPSSNNNKDDSNKPRPTFRDYVQQNGLGGREIVIGGRICLAHEDAYGYRDAMLTFLDSN